MEAIFTGAGAGFERGSGSVLGSMGLLGNGALGRNGEQVMLNAANGNLLISQRDEFLVGRGPDAAISRTYNSLGQFDGDNGSSLGGGLVQSTSEQIFNSAVSPRPRAEPNGRFAGTGCRSIPDIVHRTSA